MSIIVFSPFGTIENNIIKGKIYDNSFGVPNELPIYETGNYVVVILENQCSEVETFISLLNQISSLDDCLAQLTGRFSFLVYNRMMKEMDILRSITANPVFYHYAHDNQLYISNDLTAMSLLGNGLNEKYFHLYLYTELTETEHTPYNGIKRLLPGYRLTKMPNHDLVTKSFWSPYELENIKEPIEDQIRIFSNLLSEIIYESINNNNNIGIEVSGGLDSSSISCIADRLRNKDSTMYGFTYMFDHINDGKSNKEKVDVIYQNTRLIPEYLPLSNYWSFKDANSGIQNYDEPSPLILNFSMFRDLNQAAKDRGIKVILSGEGGDELLLSSSHYLQDLLFQGHMKRVFTELMGLATKNKQPLWKVFSTHVLPAVLPSKFKYKLESIVNKPTWHNTGFSLNWYHTHPWINEEFKKVTYEEVEVERRKIRDNHITSIYLQENFERLVLVNPCPWLDNNIGKPLGIQRIYPFRDDRLIKFFFSLPFMMKKAMSDKKSCIKKGLKDVIPEEILLKPDRSRFAEIFRKGFDIEARLVNELIQESRTAKMGWIHKELLQQAVNRFRFGYTQEVGPIARIFGLELWLRHHGY